MSGNGLPFVGNFNVYFIVFSNTHHFRIFITNTNTPFFYSNRNTYLNPTLHSGHMGMG